MKCFYHPQADAVGVCKNCQRGLCPECYAEVEHGLACKNRCEQRVIVTDILVSRSIVALQKAPRSYLLTVLVFVSMGILLLALGISTSSTARDSSIVFLYYLAGLVFLGVGLYWFRLGTQISKHKR